MGRTLVIGFGNTLRRDDGAGVRAAQEVARRLPAIDVITGHELRPELADDIAHCSTVIFIDADIEAQSVTLRPIIDVPGEYPSGSHGLSPASLVALCRSLYQSEPERSWLVGIPAHDFAFGDELSARTMQFVNECVDLVCRQVKVE